MGRLTRHWRFPKGAERLPDGMAGGEPTQQDYADLFLYFLTGWAAYRTRGGSGANYPGWPSYYDTSTDPIEGFARVMPLLAAWCASGRPCELQLPHGGRLSLPEEFRRGLVAGTDPGGPECWGTASGTNQRTVEAADIALALWLFRDTVWPSLRPGEQEAVVDWLALLSKQPSLDNNWHLFFVLVDRVLAALGRPGLIPDAPLHYDRLKEFHLGDGWFKDGPEGRVDFYNAWAFHYLLTWIDRIDPSWDPSFIRACQRRFVGSYRHLIAPHGLPIMGRSIPYRLAAPAPLVAAADSAPDLVSPAEARRALDAVWGYFVRRGALRHGTVTAGYLGPDPRIVDRYSGPASSLWSLRSLVMAFWFPEQHPFWRAEPAPLPVERGDYCVCAAGGRWKIHGDRSRQAVTIEVLENPDSAAPALQPFGRFPALRNLLWGHPPRPHNIEAKYGRRYYSSDRPFCVDEANSSGSAPGATVPPLIRGDTTS